MRAADQRRSRSQADWVLPGMEEGRFLTGESTPEGDRALLPRARREAGGGEARPRRRLLRQRRGRHRPRRRLPGRRKWSTPSAPATASRSAWSARCSKAAGARRGAPRRLDRRPRGAGARRHRRPADARRNSRRPGCERRRKNVLVFRELPADQLARLQAAHDVTVANPRVAAQQRRLRRGAADGAGPDRLELSDRRRAARAGAAARSRSPASRSASTTTTSPRCTRAASCCATRRACSTRPSPTRSSRC